MPSSPRACTPICTARARSSRPPSGPARGRHGGAVAACTAQRSAPGGRLVCGNGGSASDAMHITGELVGRFLVERPALSAICLADNPSVLTAWSNDYTYETVFARQVEAYGGRGAILGLSTSGNSPNVMARSRPGGRLGMTTMALTGEGGGRMAAWPTISWPCPRARPR